MSISVLILAAYAFCSEQSHAQEPAYTIETFAGSDPAQNNGFALNVVFEGLRGITVDPSGYVYVSDTARHQVARIAPSGEFRYIAGTGRAGFSGDGGPANEAALNSPYGLAADRSGNLYIADLQNGRIRVVSADGRIRTVAGGGTTLVTAAGASATAATLNSPRNIAVDAAGNLYVSEFEGHRILRLTTDGRIAPFAGTGISGPATEGNALNVTFSYPAGLHMDNANNLYVADSSNHAIRRITNGQVTTVRLQTPGLLNLPTGVTMDPSGNLYAASSGFDHALRVSPLGNADIVVPGARDLAVDASGNLLVISASMVRKVTSAGATTVIAGSSSQFRGDGGAANQALLFQPSDIKPDRAGGWFIADAGNHRVRRISASGVITTVAGTGIAGFSGDDGPAIQARLSNPQSIAADSEGNLYIADTDNHRIRRVGTNGVITTVAGAGIAGFNGDLRPALEAQLNRPASIAFDSIGWLLISDTGNHRICRLLPSGVLVSIAGSSAAGYTGDGGPASAARLNLPRGLATDSQDNLYVADSANHCVRRITLNGIITTYAGNGRMGFTGDGQKAIEASFTNVLGVAVDATGNLFISDADTLRIRRVSAAGIVITVAGSGLRGSSGDGGAALQARLDDPLGLAVDATGAILIADRLNNRIRRLLPSAAQSPVEVSPEWKALNAASQLSAPAVPGIMLSLQGTNIGPKDPVSGRPGVGGVLETTLSNFQVRFDGYPAPILYAQSNLIQVQVPYRVASQLTTQVELVRDGQVRSNTALTVGPAAPGIFTTGPGSGPAAALNEDYSLNSAASPAMPGSLLTFYATGEGAVDPAPIDGKVSTDPYPKPVLPMQVSVGGQAAEIVRLIPSATSPGIAQITIRLPAGGNGGTQPLVLTVAGVASQSGVTIFVKQTQ